jgi:DNA-binding HxlR family transcriptional regulator
MLGRLYEGQICSAARALEVVGERWSLLIIRDAMFAGITRYSDFQKSLGIAPNILAKRLEDFVCAGIFERRAPDASGHAEYVLTQRGLDLMPVIVALTDWGDRWEAPQGRPVVFEHQGCGGRVKQRLFCSGCGQRVASAHVCARLRPRFRANRAKPSRSA